MLRSVRIAMSFVKGESSRKGKGREDDIEMVEKPVNVRDLYHNLRIAMPEPFNGEHSKLKGFLIQVNLYLNFYKTKFNSNIERIL